MDYRVKITITDGTDFVKDLYFTVQFITDENDYGNGTYLYAESPDGHEYYVDIRYDRDYDPARPIAYIIKWVYDTWSGKCKPCGIEIA